MGKNKNKIVLLTATILIAIFIWSPLFKSGGGKKKSVKYIQALKPTENETDLSLIIASTLYPQKETKSSYVDWGRNPFMEAPFDEGRAIALNGIIWDVETPQALINDKIVNVGDKVGVNTVIDILQDKVILNDGAGNFELELGSGH